MAASSDSAMPRSRVRCGGHTLSCHRLSRVLDGRAAQIARALVRFVDRVGDRATARRSGSFGRLLHRALGRRTCGVMHCPFCSSACIDRSCGGELELPRTLRIEGRALAEVDIL